MKVVVVVGESGSGKSTVTWMAHERGIIPTVVSYTTRPMRAGEINGKEHWFVKPEDKPNDLFAYTKFGEYEYWTSITQLQKLGDMFTYVIDEDGIDFLENNKLVDDMSLYKIKIKRANKDNIDTDRINRDKNRFNYPDSYFDAVIVNDGTLDELYNKFITIVKNIGI